MTNTTSLNKLNKKIGIVITVTYFFTVVMLSVFFQLKYDTITIIETQKASSFAISETFYSTYYYGVETIQLPKIKQNSLREISFPPVEKGLLAATITENESTNSWQAELTWFFGDIDQFHFPLSQSFHQGNYDSDDYLVYIGQAIKDKNKISSKSPILQIGNKEYVVSGILSDIAGGNSDERIYIYSNNYETLMRDFLSSYYIRLSYYSNNPDSTDELENIKTFYSLLCDDKYESRNYSPFSYGITSSTIVMKIIEYGIYPIVACCILSCITIIGTFIRINVKGFVIRYICGFSEKDLFILLLKKLSPLLPVSATAILLFPDIKAIIIISSSILWLFVLSSTTLILFFILSNEKRRII